MGERIRDSYRDVASDLLTTPTEHYTTCSATYIATCVAIRIAPHTTTHTHTHRKTHILTLPTARTARTRYKALERGKWVKVGGWKGTDDTMALLEQTQQTYKKANESNKDIVYSKN